MPPLRYKYIGSEQHLTFDSIRRLVIHQLSNLDRRRAWSHIEQCNRCRSIHESLARPEKVIKRRSSSSYGSKLLIGALLIAGLIALPISWEQVASYTNVSCEDISTIYSWGLLKIQRNKLSTLNPQPPNVTSDYNFKKYAFNAFENTIEPVAGNYPFQHYGRTVISSNQQRNPQIDFNEIQGVITMDDKPLQGVTIMVPSSKTAKISNADGKYQIQVPHNTVSLLFIYQGKQLSKILDTTDGTLDINLSIDSMKYPEVGSPPLNQELVADN